MRNQEIPQERTVSALQAPVSSSSRFLTVENILIAAFVLLGIIGISHHELWRDEAQAWLLARDSQSLLDLFYNARYEFHPLLWHLCLYPLAKIIPYPWVMQAFHLLLATGSIVLIVKTSPFSLLQKGLLSISYFLFYEYSLISRNYAIGVFLIFLFCALYTQKKPKYWSLAIVLALLANASVFGLTISFALGTTLLYRALTERRDSGSGRSRQVSAVRQVMPQAILLLASWMVSIAQVTWAAIFLLGGTLSTNADPAAVESEPALAGVWHQIDQISRLADLILKSYLPLPQFGINFWNEHFLGTEGIFPSVGPLSLGLFIGIALAVIAVITSLKILWKTPFALWIYTSTCVILAIFHSVFLRGATRHYGHFFIIFLVCLWLATWSQQPKRPHRTPAIVGGTFLTILLVFQAVSGVHAYTTDLIYPFSSSREIANYIQTHQLEDMVLFAQDDRKVTGIASYLNCSIYYPQRGVFGSFWNDDYPELATTQALIESIEAFGQQQPNFLAILGDPIDPGAVASEVILLMKPHPTIRADERLFLYLVQSNLSP
ncbi:MAG: hypothetical protein WA885_11535 [Phormidesmis sp.]